MDPLLAIASFAALALLILSRWLNERALKQISADQKAALVDLFSGQRTWNYGLVLVLIIGYWLLVSTQVIDAFAASMAYLGFTLLLMSGSSLLTYRKLKAANMDEGYIKNYLISSGVRLLAIVVFASMAIGVFGR